MKSIFTLCFVVFGFTAFSQSITSKEQKLKEARIITEQKLRSSFIKFTYFPNSINESDFSFLNADGGVVGEDGIFSRIQFLDESGYPFINFIDNEEAAVTTGAASLQPGGELDLDLTGKGLTVGIFDQTRPKVDHVEYEGRLTQIDGSTETLSTHSTHVSGTVMGAGINAAARGMAYEAEGWSFNWDNDVSKMTSNAYDPDTKPSGMLLSNHSYSRGIGWEGSNWFGDPSISTEESVFFGYYSELSAAMDQVVFSNPYYLPVFAAGNDRGESGDGTRPPDGPSDILGPRAVSKNSLTIGAVQRVLDYQGPQSVVMSSFSSWGPTDDGRIKPDFVAMGVNVFSASINSNGEDSYASQSGTSMAAPNVTGSLFLLQQLYSQRNAGRFMLASTVKSLGVHTAKEAGPAPGPDYMNGWGLLDVEAGAKIILEEDGVSQFIKEDILANGEVFEFEFVSDGVTPIKATIAWTDPAGSPVGVSLDPEDLMLVNDLDLRVFGEDGTEFFPWTLDPNLEASARGINTDDNFRDNVEKIEINNPSAQKYTVRVSHKGELEFDVQQYSMVFNAGTTGGSDETLYWIGADGESWSSPSNWSTEANGASAGRIPGEGTRVVFEGDSDGVQEVLFSETANAFSVNFFGNQLIKLSLEGNSIEVTNGFRVSNQITEIENGSIVFSGVEGNEQLVELGQATFSDVNLRFSTGDWKIISASALDEVTVENAELSLDVESFNVGTFEVGANASLSGGFTEIIFSEELDISSGATLKEGVSLVFNGNSGLFTNESSADFESLSSTSGELVLNSGGFVNLNLQDSQITMNVPSLAIGDLNLGPDALLSLGNGGQLEVVGDISSDATSGSRARIVAPVTGILNYPVYRKYCFDFIDVNSVNLTGDGIINLGTNAEVTDSSGWLEENCDDVLFANYSFQFNCVGAALTFENLSEGAISEYEWDFDGLGTSSLAEPIFVFDTPGNYTVSLKVSNDEGFTMFEQEIVVLENDIIKPIIVANGNVLTSQQPGEAYQWYSNGQVVEGATSRSFEVPGDGSYQVAIVDGACNRVSDPVVISAIEEDEPELSRFGVFVGPIPSDDVLNITISNDYTGPIEFRLVDLAGRVLVQEEKSKISRDMEVKMNLPSQNGLYILRINTNSLTLHKKVIKQ